MTNPFLTSNNTFDIQALIKLSFYENETYKAIPGYKNYYITNFGRAYYCSEKYFTDGKPLINNASLVQFNTNTKKFNNAKWYQSLNGKTPVELLELVVSKKVIGYRDNNPNNFMKANLIFEESITAETKQESVVVKVESKKLENNSLMNLSIEDLGKALVCGKDSIPEYLSKMTYKEFYMYVQDLEKSVIDDAIELYLKFSKPKEIIETTNKPSPLRKQNKQGV